MERDTLDYEKLPVRVYGDRILLYGRALTMDLNQEEARKLATDLILAASEARRNSVKERKP
jgi:hypothetical protein